MPELPEVQTVVARLDASLRGAEVRSIDLRRADVVLHGPSDLQARLRGRKVRGFARHGKRILCRLDGDVEVVFHLGMSGTLFLSPRSSARDGHTHLVMRFAGRADELRFRDPRRFGGLWLAGRESAAGRFSIPPGPDALSIRLPAFRRLLRRRRQIKALLLDQSAIAGLGNIYVDEALYRSRVHPQTRASVLDDAEVGRVLGSIRTVLRDAIRSGGSSLRDYRNADGERGWFQVRHRVYGRDGLPCRRCGATITRIVLASRSTHVCPVCQVPKEGTERS